MIYAATLFWNEWNLLKLWSTELDGCHKIVVTASHTFRGRPHYKPSGIAEHCTEHRHVFVGSVDGVDRSACKRRNAIQRNKALPRDFADDDVLIFSDVDEITHREDLPDIIEAAQRLGLVRLRMRIYYHAINMLRGTSWNKPLAVAGWWFNRHRFTLDALRQSNLGKTLNTQGQHFSWLGDWQTKIKNHAHPENDNPTVANRLRRFKSPKGETLLRVPVDSTYPQAIRDNLDAWAEFIA